jgi:DNA-binding response OmpR family regulator/Tfp pilus assembly protein PilZ
VKRVLVAAEDRRLTKFVAESLLQRAITREEPGMRSDAWDLSRAHSSLELSILINHGQRSFDVVVLDQGLPGQDCLEIIADIRRFEATQNVSIFVMSERGRDQLVRRIATERYFVTGFIDKPVSAVGLRSCLASLGRQRRIMLIDSDSAQAQHLALSLRNAGYSVEIIANGTLALNSLSYGRPDAIVCNTKLPDIPGAHVCARLKQNPRTHNIPILLVGAMEELAQTPIDENAHRADDFLRRPFSPADLLEKVSILAGLNDPHASDTKTDPNFVLEVPPRLARARDQSRTAIAKPAISTTVVVEDGIQTLWDQYQSGEWLTAPVKPSMPGPQPSMPQGIDDHVISSTRETPLDPISPSASRPIDFPPPSASPGPHTAPKRATRRVPCQVTVTLEDGQAIHQSQTLNISNGGVLISTQEKVEMGMRLNLSFALPASDETITATGRIAWLSRPPPGFDGDAPRCVAGVKFSQIAPEHLRLIVDYVNRVAKVVYVAP